MCPEQSKFGKGLLYVDETDYRNRVNDALRNQTVSPDQRDDEYWQELDANGCLI